MNQPISLEITITRLLVELVYDIHLLHRQISAIVDLVKNWTKGERDLLYTAGINPIRKNPAGGTAVWGQKTLQVKASATDRVNVRRLLVTIEKAVTISLDDYVFELNDRTTRILITNMIDGYLSDIAGNRGLYDYRVVCDESNNDGEVIDRNELWVDIYVKPVRAAEFIQLRTIITRTDVSFEEVIGTV